MFIANRPTVLHSSYLMCELCELISSLRVHECLNCDAVVKSCTIPICFTNTVHIVVRNVSDAMCFFAHWPCPCVVKQWHITRIPYRLRPFGGTFASTRCLERFKPNASRITANKLARFATRSRNCSWTQRWLTLFGSDSCWPMKRSLEVHTSDGVPNGGGSDGLRE